LKTVIRGGDDVMKAVCACGMTSLCEKLYTYLITRHKRGL